MTVCALSTEDLLRKLAQTDGGSDLIITVGRPPLLRVFKELAPIEGMQELTAEDAEHICMSILSEKQRNTFEEDMEIDTSLVVDEIRYRINIYKQCGTHAMAARVIVDDIPSFEALHLPEVLAQLATLQRGLLLITGTIGSGKSTTTAAILDYINHRRKCHIITIEDPVEYVHKHDLATVDQREVGIDTHSFAAGLRSILRQSADIVVIGEMRDRESAQAALTLAETGHLTIATLHTRGVAPTITRLIDMFPPEQQQQMRGQLSASIAGVICQQLIPAKGGKGLIPACEVMTATPAIRALIRNGNLHEVYSLVQSGKKYGMCTMEQAIEELLKKGMVDTEWLKENYSELNVSKA